MVRDGLSALLSSVPSITVAGVAATGREAVQAAVTLRPGVLVMDIQMPELNGVAATREISRVAPGVAGEAIFGPGIARRVLGLVTAPPAASDPFPGLTSREQEVLGLIAAGARNAEIARKMSIAPKTVANHISAIFAKLQVADRGAAIILARDAGLGRGNPAD